MPQNSLFDLRAAGQSIWLDYIDRTMLHDGGLARRIDEDALTGMTSNPTIFEKAMAEGHAYDAQVSAAPPEIDPWVLFEALETDDVRSACDIFRRVFQATGGADGYVSIEVSPGAARDATRTIEEAHRLWRTVNRPNVMIKVPGTVEGAVAVRQLTADGINVNITLLFSLDAHARVIEAYLSGLEARLTAGAPIDHLASVASFFVSRVDTEVDRRFDAMLPGISSDSASRVEALRGTIAIANAKLAYALFRERFTGPRWDALAARGARLQRPLWASTSTKNPKYRDVMYVEDLIGPDTVNTMTPATIDAFHDHGVVRRTVDTDLTAERRRIADLESLGIPLRDVTDKLLTDGLASFGKSFDTLIGRLSEKSRTLVGK